MKDRFSIFKYIDTGFISSSLVFSTTCQSTYVCGLRYYQSEVRQISEGMIDKEYYYLNLIAERCSDILLSVIRIKDIGPVISALELLIYTGQKNYREKAGKDLKQEDGKKQ